MPSVHLDFIPPDEPDLVSLHIEEAPTAGGAWVAIEEVTAIGEYGNYITEYTTDDATGLTQWFRIRWEDSKGAFTPYSQAVQGGTESLVSEIVDRVMLRDPNIKEGVALQEAEAAIHKFYKADPYSIDLASVNAEILSGLTLMTMARCYIFSSLSESESEDYTAGIISQKSSSDKKVNLDWLIAQANGFLGTNYSVVMVMEEIEIAGGYAGEVTMDQTRLIVEFP